MIVRGSRALQGIMGQNLVKMNSYSVRMPLLAGFAKKNSDKLEKIPKREKIVTTEPPTLAKDKAEAIKEREFITQHLETMGKDAPRNIALLFAVMTIPVFIPGVGALITPYDDPAFVKYMTSTACAVFGVNLMSVGGSNSRDFCLAQP